MSYDGVGMLEVLRSDQSDDMIVFTTCLSEWSWSGACPHLIGVTVMIGVYSDIPSLSVVFVVSDLIFLVWK